MDYLPPDLRHLLECEERVLDNPGKSSVVFSELERQFVFVSSLWEAKKGNTVTIFAAKLFGRFGRGCLLGKFVPTQV